MGPAEQCPRIYDRFFGGTTNKYYQSTKTYPFVECFTGRDGKPTSFHLNAGAFKRFHKDPKKPLPVKGDRIRIGGFNVFHMGDDLAKFKDYAMVAGLINQWDIAGLVELMPSGSRCNGINEAIDQAIASTQSGALTYKMPNGTAATVEDLRAQYCEPGYVKLLKALMKLDPSWALILTPTPAGEADSGKELAGIVYRGRHVALLANEFCNNVYGAPAGAKFLRGGCYAKFGGDYVAQTVPESMVRPPFLASFRAGQFDFTLLAAHMRFRHSKKEGVFETILEKVLGGQGFGVPSTPGKFNDGDKKVLTRFGEIVSTIRLMERIRNFDAKKWNERDVILVGDFNLQLGPKTSKGTGVLSQEMWDYALGSMPGSSLVFNEKTSLSAKFGLASAYDHFVLDVGQKKTSECNPATARRYDFTFSSFPEGEPLPTLAQQIERITGIRAFLDKVRGDPAFLRTQKDRVKQDYASRWAPKPAASGAETGESVVLFPEAEVEKRVGQYEDSLVTLPRDPAKKYLSHAVLISDHIPISMECSTNPQGDDD